MDPRALEHEVFELEDVEDYTRKYLNSYQGCEFRSTIFGI